ncbi:MAG: glycosyltransferase family 2 protein [Chthoniobacterales bacterium]
MTVSIIITTRNRARELQRTCEVITGLSPSPVEILITADCCSDETIELIRERFVDVTLIDNLIARGSVASRDRMMRQAKGDLVLALDDDSYPEEVDCIARIMPFFEQNSRLAVLHFPQRSDEYPETLEKSEFGLDRLTHSFANSGAVLRRSIYLQLPGFEPKFFHMYEEPDYALQCIAAGCEVLFSPVVTIRHHYSGEVRSELRNHHLHARNELWSVLLRCPFPYLCAMVIYRPVTQFGYACKRGATWILREPAWWWSAIKGLPWVIKKRQPVRWSAYKKWLSLS